jgi:SAM-dependent methyltransferase
MGADAGNPISGHWYQTFLNTVDPARTITEVAFLGRQLPLSSHSRILDLCCGRGRHALRLAEAGYHVTGIDSNATVIESARTEAGPGAEFVRMDVRHFERLTQRWDAAIILWASFGYFSRDENLALLASVRRSLTPAGRLVLDVYNRDFFESRLGVRRLHRGGQDVVEHTSMADGRLTTKLAYDGHDVIDQFSWEIFRPDELVDTAIMAGFHPEVLCADFDEAVRPTPGYARMQLVSARVSS